VDFDATAIIHENMYMLNMFLQVCPNCVVLIMAIFKHVDINRLIMNVHNT
jgi:hypothetical protein